MSILSIIKELQSTSGTNAKIEILKSIVGTEFEQTFKEVCVYALDGRINYWITDFKDPDICTGDLNLDDLFDTLTSISKREVTGHAAKDKLVETLSYMRSDDVDVARLIIKRDLECGVGAKTINKVWPNLIYIHPYMRCSSYSAKNLQNITLPAYSQTKADGSYTDIIVDRIKQTVTYQSRSGEYKNYGTEEMNIDLLEMSKDVPFDKFVLQGEALVEQDGRILARETGNGILNSDDCVNAKIIFDLWDIVEYAAWIKGKDNASYEQRLNTLNKMIWDSSTDRFQTIETRIVNTPEEIIEHFEQNISNGLEGTVLKDKNGVWANTTSKHQVKVKIIAEAEFVIKDYIEGTGKNVDKLGAFVVETSDGLLRTRVGGGYTDKQREQYWDRKEMLIGTVMTVRFNNIVKNQDDEALYSLFLPRHIELRKDKKEADTLERVREQLASTKDILELMSQE